MSDLLLWLYVVPGAISLVWLLVWLVFFEEFEDMEVSIAEALHYELSAALAPGMNIITAIKAVNHAVMVFSSDEK